MTKRSRTDSTSLDKEAAADSGACQISQTVWLRPGVPTAIRRVGINGRSSAAIGRPRPLGARASPVPGATISTIADRMPPTNRRLDLTMRSSGRFSNRVVSSLASPAASVRGAASARRTTNDPPSGLRHAAIARPGTTNEEGSATVHDFEGCRPETPSPARVAFDPHPAPSDNSPIRPKEWTTGAEPENLDMRIATPKWSRRTTHLRAAHPRMRHAAPLIALECGRLLPLSSGGARLALGESTASRRTGTRARRRERSYDRASVVLGGRARSAHPIRASFPLSPGGAKCLDRIGIRASTLGMPAEGVVATRGVSLADSPEQGWAANRETDRAAVAADL